MELRFIFLCWILNLQILQSFFVIGPHYRRIRDITITSFSAIVSIVENNKATHEYEFDEKIIAGIALTGTEVKSCRKGGGVQLSDGIAEIRDGECWLLNVFISEYGRCGQRNQQHLPKRSRKLLLHAREILKLEQRVLQRNYEIIPLRMFFAENNFIKVELGVGKQKSLTDKRDDIQKRDGEREIRRVMKCGGYD